MNTTLASLIALQQIDKVIFEMRQKIERVPKAIAELDELLVESQEKAATLRASIDDQERTRRSKEAEIEKNTELMKKYQGQLLQVKTNKEYSALLAEINGLKSKNTLIEDDIIELMESIERAKKAVKQAQDELARNKARVEENTLKLREEQQAWQHELEQEEQTRATQMEGIQSGVLREYSRLLQMRNGIAVAAVGEQGVCMGCRVSLTPQTFSEVRSGDALLRCPICFRFLYSENAVHATEEA